MIRAINFAFNLYTLAILARVVISWLRPTIYHPQVRSIIRIIYDITEPVLLPIRKRLPSALGLDFSPLIALFLLDLVRRFLFRLLIILY